MAPNSRVSGATLSRRTVADEIGATQIVVSADLRVALIDPACQLLISVDSAGAGFVAAARDVLGVPLPLEPNRIVGDDISCVWLAPGHWLAVAETPVDGGFIERTARTIAAAGGMASDVTDGLAVFEIEGPAARELLAMGTKVDLRAARFGIGQSARTVFAGVRATLYPHRSAERFRIHVERAVARHVHAWLMKAASALAPPGT
jgi:sarcosine oxidase subunit gamma